MGKLDQSFCCKSIWMVIKAPCQSFIEFESFSFCYFILFYFIFLFFLFIPFSCRRIQFITKWTRKSLYDGFNLLSEELSLYSAILRGKIELLMCKEVRCKRKYRTEMLS